MLAYDKTRSLDVSVFDSPYIRGVALQIHWSDIEHTQGSPDWSVLDQLFQRANASGKWVQLLIFPGFYTPAWARGANPEKFPIQYGPGHGQEGMLPMPWDSTYLADWSIFVGLLGHRYGADPAFRVVAADGPTSVSAETTMPNKAADQTQWKAAGYTQTRYVQAWRSVLETYAADFPNQYISIAGGAGSNSIVNIDANGNIVADPNLGTKQQIVDLATKLLGNRFVLQNSNLDGSAGGDRPNTDYVISYIGRVVTGFQLRTTVEGAGMGTGGPAAVLRTTLENGTRARADGKHVDYIEIYSPDIENPSLASTLAYGASLFAPPTPPRPPLPPPRPPCSGTRCQ